MNKKAEMNYIGLIVISAIAIIIGASLLANTVAPNVGKMNTKVTINKEVVTIATARLAGTGSINASRYFNLANGCPFTIGNWRLSDTSDCAISVSSITLGNGTALTETIDYVINTTAGTGRTDCTNTWGDIRFVNSSVLGWGALDTNTTNVTYSYCNEGYIPTNNSGARAILPLIVIFFALLIMVVAIIPIFRNGFLQMIGLQ